MNQKEPKINEVDIDYVFHYETDSASVKCAL